MKGIKYASFFCLILPIFQSFAWSHFLRIINNSDIPLQFKFSSNIGNAYPALGTVSAHTQSTEIKLTESASTACWRHGSSSCDKGDIDIIQNNQVGTFTYLGIANKHAFNTLNYVTGPSPFPDDTVLTNAPKDCDNPYNCIFVNPNANWVMQALKWQDKIDQFEPLNKEQFISTHNSAVSSHYVSLIDTKLAYNQYLTLTQQLNVGVRAFELDILRYKGQVHICHLHNKPNLEPLICAKSATLKTVLIEINTWLINHPNQFIVLYLDVNNKLSPIGANAVDAVFAATMPKKVYTVADANHLPLTSENPKYNRPLNLTSISQAKLLAMIPKKQVIVIAKQYKGLANSPYVFTSAMDNAGKDIPILNDPRIKKIYTLYQQGGCTAVNHYFSNSDKDHRSIWRGNGDRAPISAISGGKDYVTVDKINVLQSCRLNSLSMERLVSPANHQPLDPRLAAQVWSWAQGYPLKVTAIANNSQRYAVIDPNLDKFKNDVAAPLLALCYDSLAQSHWQAVKIHAVAQARQACQLLGKGWHFSTPVTSYQMAQANTVIKQVDKTRVPILVNYFAQCHNEACQWIANNGKPLS